MRHVRVRDGSDKMYAAPTIAYSNTATSRRYQKPR